MKLYRLSAGDDSSWLRPADVAARLSDAFPRVVSDASIAKELGKQFIAQYRKLREAGLGDNSSVPIETIEQRWSGALHIEIWIDEKGEGRFSTLAKNETYLELAFAPDISRRQHRSLANQAANSLGYSIESVDND